LPAAACAVSLLNAIVEAGQDLGGAFGQHSRGVQSEALDGHQRGDRGIGQLRGDLVNRVGHPAPRVLADRWRP
jgi:hypothetical protein